MDPIIELLKTLKYVGKFPQQTTALLVPFDTALAEAKLVDSTQTPKTLRTLLRKNNIHVFNSIDDWMKFKSGKQ